MSFNRLTRKLHRWGALVTLLPLLLVVATGLLLQLKKQIPWVQPATLRGSGKELAVSWDGILESVKSYPNSRLQSWDEIDRLDVRPGKGVAKVRGKNRWEYQVDLSSGEVLACNYRRSDLIESLHDGSFFSDGAKLWIFFPSGLILLGLWATGAWLWILPHLVRRKKRIRNRRSTGGKS